MEPHRSANANDIQVVLDAARVLGDGLRIERFIGANDAHHLAEVDGQERHGGFPGIAAERAACLVCTLSATTTTAAAAV